MKIHVTTIIAFLLLSPVIGRAAPQITDTSFYRVENSNQVVYGGEIALSQRGVWTLSTNPAADGSRIHVYLLSPWELDRWASSIRQDLEKKIRLSATGREILLNCYNELKNRHKTDNNSAAANTADIDHQSLDALDRQASELWLRKTGKRLQGPFVYLVPGVSPEPATKPAPSPAKKKKILMLELRPYINDGKHWKLYTDGTCVREDIDRDFISAHGLVIRPIIPEALKPVMTRDGKNSAKPYRIIAEGEESEKWTTLPLTFENTYSGEKITLSWDLDKHAPIDPFLLRYRDLARYLQLQPYQAILTSSPVYQAWMKKKGWDILSDASRAASLAQIMGRELSVFNILGGRAAIEETLQLQPLQENDTEDTERNIPISSLKGVEVESHPFETMLAGHDDRTIGLADLVPHDRFFVYTPRPAAILPFLDQGARFIGNLGGVMSSSNISYDLPDRYLAALGLDNSWLQKLLESSAIRETALFFPDLFFIEGTDVTVLARVSMPKLVKPFLLLAGISGLEEGEIITRTLENGRKVHWSILNDILVISTSEDEMHSVLALGGSNGTGSLGRSHEFRYMLSQLPLRPETRFYAYFSDPFIRRLVSPATKIAQLRRLVARRNLEELTAGMLLARYEGYQGPMTVPGLIEAGYAFHYLGNGDFSIDRDGVAHSVTYGTLADLRPLADIPVTAVSEAESLAYKNYLDNYNRYWRRFFDPIALRLDDMEDASLELTTFILPLIRNSVYDGLKTLLASREDDIPLRIPEITPKPVVMFSMNIPRKEEQKAARRDILRFGAEFFNNYTSIQPGIIKTLGPGIHFAILDADPVIALGSGDILGAFSGGTLNIVRGGGMMLYPIALSMLTRPCVLLIETSDPQKTLSFLQKASTPSFRDPRRAPRGVEHDFYRTSGRNEWIYALNIFNTIKIRLGIVLQGNYLQIRNIPWTSLEETGTPREMELNGAQLEIAPAACEHQLPALFTSAAEQGRKTTFKGLGYLYPLMVSTTASVDEASEIHARLFGFRPVYRADDHWKWDGRELSSLLYGSVRKPVQPAHVAGDRDFGLLKDIDAMSLSMQFEESGLRASLRWKLRTR
ncbi:MAG: hypothetical protein Kow0089_12160 [Desulfobulbaceae bacterium]